MDFLFKVKKLEGCDDYREWKVSMKLKLGSKNLWRAIEPGDNLEGQTSSVDHRVDSRALMEIFRYTCVPIHYHLEDVPSAKNAWEILESLFERHHFMQLDNQLRGGKKMADIVNADSVLVRVAIDISGDGPLMILFSP